MTKLRCTLLRRRWLAAWIVAAALLMRLLVPAGYMAVYSAGGIAIELCSGVSAPAASMSMPGVAMPDMHHGGERPEGHVQPEAPCAFAALSAPTLAAADPLILAVALAFIFSAIFDVRRFHRLKAAPFLRPPLRGPPAIA